MNMAAFIIMIHHFETAIYADFGPKIIYSLTSPPTDKVR